MSTHSCSTILPSTIIASELYQWNREDMRSMYHQQEFNKTNSTKKYLTTKIGRQTKVGKVNFVNQHIKIKQFSFFARHSQSNSLKRVPRIKSLWDLPTSHLSLQHAFQIFHSWFCTIRHTKCIGKLLQIGINVLYEM